MINCRNRNNVFLSMLILDSIEQILKLGFAVWFLTAIIQENRRFEREPVPVTHYTYGYVLFVALCGCSGLFVWILLRLAANYHQYRREKLKNISKCCCCGTFCWFFLGIIHLVYTGIFIFVNWCTFADETYPTCRWPWPRNAAIGFLFWETFIFGVMAIHKKNKIDRTNHSQSEP